MEQVHDNDLSRDRWKSGLGRNAAVDIAKRGDDVILTYRSGEGGAIAERGESQNIAELVVLGINAAKIKHVALLTVRGSIVGRDDLEA